MSLRTLLRSSESERGQIHIGGRLDGHRVVVPLLAGEPAGIVDQIRVGVAIASARGGSVRVEDPVANAETAYRTITPNAEPESVSLLLEWALDRGNEPGDRVDGILAARRTERRVHEQVRRDEADTLILPRSTGSGTLGRRRLRRIAHRAPCNVIWINGEPGFREFASILLPIADGPHSGLATDVAGAIAQNVDAYVDILHVVPTEAEEAVKVAADEQLDAAKSRIDLGDQANPWILQSDNPAETIAEQSNYYGLTVIGAPTAGRLRQLVYGSTSQSIRSAAQNMVIATRTPETLR